MAGHGLAAYFSVDEVKRLEDGIPNLSDWSTNLLVPFQACKVPTASVAWINERWFHEHQINTADSASRNRIDSWLLGDFAYISSADPAQVNLNDTRVLHADRYGSSTGLGCHGGSGRVAIDGCFQAKGVGQTPLVSVHSRAGHSHGCMSLLEAVREAIFSEVASAEFPQEVIPIIAIIDTGLNFSSPDHDDIYDQDARRAIAIRPVAVRVAHAERAPMFKISVSGFKNIQADDVSRVKDVIDTWVVAYGAVDDMEGSALRLLLSRIVDQIAFGQVHRLFCGGFFSSNITIDGGFLDFGNMHALPDWSRAQVHSIVEGAGAELKVLDVLVQSLSFHLAKYRKVGDGTRLSADFFQGIDRTYTACWRRHATAMFQLCGAPSVVAEAVYRLIFDYYSVQQRNRVKYRFGKVVARSGREAGSWLYPGVVEGQKRSVGAPEDTVLRQLNNVMRRGLSSDQRRVAWQTAARVLKPRDGLDRYALLSELGPVTTGKRGNLPADFVGRFITRKVDEGRRFWPRLADGISVRGHVTRAESSALLTDYSRGSCRRVWLEGVAGENRSVIIFGQSLGEDEALAIGLAKSNRYWIGCVDVTAEKSGYSVALNGRQLSIPAMSVIYAKPSKDWIS